ncbi:MAG TPA: PAS domain S-box protein, partial [Anaerovoracaceae bacterium]|nr:PAS domain S-box protein [Anaerovoracaceae bacterium]
MNQSAFLGLIQNTALLLAMALLFDLVSTRNRSKFSSLWQVPLGIILGGIGIALMLTPWVLTPGIIFDTRSILLGISGLFFGSIPTIIAIIMTAAFRIYQGGTAVWMGVSVIVTTGTIGILWRRLNKKTMIDYSGWELYLFGIAIHIVMLVCAFVLPIETTFKVLSNISLPVMTIYPFGTLLLGLLMVNQLRRERINKDLHDSEEHLRSTSVELQKSEDQYRLLTKNIKDVVWILDAETLYFRYVSPSIVRLRGYTAEEILQNPIDHGFTKKEAENLKIMIRSRVSAFQGGREESGRFYSDDIQQLCKDGSSIWTEEVTTYYTNLENGHVEILGVSRDISSRKKTEEALLASERRFRGLAESSLDNIMLYDRECRHVYENPAALKFFRKTEADINGKTHLEAGFDEIFSSNREKDIKEVLASGESMQLFVEWQSVDGMKILDWQFSPVFDQNNNVELVLGISRDITELKKAEKVLQQREEQYRVLTENIKDVVWIIDTETLTYRYVSPSVERLRGFTAEEVSQAPFDHVFIEGTADNNKKILLERAEAFLNGKETPDRFYID